MNISRPQHSMLRVAGSRRGRRTGGIPGLGGVRIDDGGDVGPRGLGQRHEALKDVGAGG